MLPRQEERAEDSAASLKLLAFEDLVHNLERVKLHVQNEVGVYGGPETPGQLKRKLNQR